MGPTNIDIHNYDGMFARAERGVQTAPISKRNKDLILRFRSICLLKGICGKVRLIRVMGVLKLYACLMQKDFDTFTKADVEELVARLMAQQPAYSPETLGTYRAILRSFLSWVLDPEHFPTKHPPAPVAWLNSHVKATHKRKLARHELLTPENIDTLLRVTSDPRDRAFLSTLWETGGRIAEIGNRTIQQVSRHQYGYTIDVMGKTGQRSPLVVSSAPHLTQWLSTHPTPLAESPLWVRSDIGGPKALGYAGLVAIIKRALRRAGITKRVYPHLFRHSRATHCVATGLMNEQQAKAYFGWSPSSKMLANYAHLTIQDANNAILRENKFAPPAQTTDILQPIACKSCQLLNAHSAVACVRCNTVFDERAIHESTSKQQATNTLVLQLYKVLVEKGLLDEAADQIHAANLGLTLQELSR